MAINKDKLVKDLETWIYSYSNAYCDRAADLLTESARLAILDFYNSYKPLEYDRYYDLRDNGYKRYKHNNGKNMYGGVYIGYQYMDEYFGKGIDHLEMVTGMTLFHGYHGYISKEYNDPYYFQGAHYSFSPYSSILQFMGSNEFHNDINNFAKNTAMQQKYEILNVTNSEHRGNFNKNNVNFSNIKSSNGFRRKESITYYG